LRQFCSREAVEKLSGKSDWLKVRTGLNLFSKPASLTFFSFIVVPPSRVQAAINCDLMGYPMPRADCKQRSRNQEHAKEQQFGLSA
jgi:hypothetical protein